MTEDNGQTAAQLLRAQNLARKPTVAEKAAEDARLGEWLWFPS